MVGLERQHDIFEMFWPTKMMMTHCRQQKIQKGVKGVYFGRLLITNFPLFLHLICY